MTSMYSVHVCQLDNGLHRIEAYCERCGRSYDTHVAAPESCTPIHVNGEWYGFIAGFLVNHDCNKER